MVHWKKCMWEWKGWNKKVLLLEWFCLSSFFPPSLFLSRCIYGQVFYPFHFSLLLLRINSSLLCLFHVSTKWIQQPKCSTNIYIDCRVPLVNHTVLVIFFLFFSLHSTWLETSFTIWYFYIYLFPLFSLTWVILFSQKICCVKMIWFWI